MYILLCYFSLDSNPEAYHVFVIFNIFRDMFMFHFRSILFVPELCHQVPYVLVFIGYTVFSYILFHIWSFFVNIGYFSLTSCSISVCLLSGLLLIMKYILYNKVFLFNESTHAGAFFETMSFFFWVSFAHSFSLSLFYNHPNVFSFFPHWVAFRKH